MKIIFFGTGRFALPTLHRLLESDHELLAVVTQPDKEKGRGWRNQSCPVKEFIEQVNSGIEVLQPEKVTDTGVIDYFKGTGADVFVVVDYGQFLNKALLDIPEKLCINLHPSLLPKYRGAAPINWAILKGEKKTGNTVIKMTERMDAGDIILQEETLIEKSKNALDLFERLSESGGDLVMKALDVIEKGNVKFVKQDESAASMAPKLQKKQGRIDWNESATEISRKIRALQPWPGAYTSLKGKVVKITKAQVIINKKVIKTPGCIYDLERFIVATGEGAICIEEVQMEGKRAMSSDEFLRGLKITADTVLGN